MLWEYEGILFSLCWNFFFSFFNFSGRNMRAEQRNVAQREREREWEREKGMSLSKCYKRRRRVQRPLQIFCLVFIYIAPGCFAPATFCFFLCFFFYFFFLLKKYYSFYYLWCEIYGVKLMVPAYFWHQLKGHFRGVSEAYPIKIAN